MYLVGNQKLSQTQTCNEKLEFPLPKIDVGLIGSKQVPELKLEPKSNSHWKKKVVLNTNL